MSEAQDLVPPHSIEAEQALLGSIFLDNDVLADITRLVPDSSLFFRGAHQVIFDAILDLYREGKEDISWITVKSVLESKGQLGEASGEEYLEEITVGTPLSEGAEQYAQIVRDKWILRESIRTFTQGRHYCYMPTADARKAVESVRKLADRLDGITVSDIPDMGDVISNVRRTVASVASEGKPPAFKTGNHKMDALTLGWQLGALSVIAGPTGSGKTFTALNLCHHFQQANEGQRAAIISLEMGPEEIVERAVVQDCFFRDAIGGRLTEEETAAVERRLDAFAANPYQIVSPSRRDIATVCARVRSLSQRGCRFIVLDHVGYMDFGKQSDTEAALQLVPELKHIAVRSKVHLVVLSQLTKKHLERTESMLGFNEGWLYGGRGAELGKAAHNIHAFYRPIREKHRADMAAKIERAKFYGMTDEEIERITVQRCVKGRRGSESFWLFWETDKDLVLQPVTHPRRHDALQRAFVEGA